MPITNHLESVKKIFIDYPRLYEVKQEELKTVSSERQDLLHALELGKLDAIKMSQIASDLKEVQIKRRQIKNNLELLSEIISFVKKTDFKGVNTKDLKQAMSRVDYITSRKRTYTMRVRTDLQELVDTEYTK